MKFGRKDLFLFTAILVIFFALRLPGLHIPYHQDEYKWPLYSEAILFPSGTIPHPPLTEFLYVQGGRLVGFDNFRYIPLIFSILNIFLVFYISRLIGDKKSAFWTLLLFATTFYSVLASLMVDVDGAVMPFFLLLMSVGYYRMRKTNFEFSISNLAIFLAGAIGGFLIKVVFIVPITAFALDFAIEKEVFSDRKRLTKYVLWILGVIAILVGILLSAKFIFPFFDLGKAIKYWRHFAVFTDRGWLQTFIQFAKAIMYISPVLALAPFLATKDIFSKFRPFFIYIFLGLFFYLFAFDFSLGALDRYFEFLVIPLCLIGGAVFSVVGLEKSIKAVTLPFIVAGAAFVLQFFNQYVPSHYPKTEWMSRAISLKWNFLFPFSGGSGPTGFYVSFAFIAIVWLFSFVLLVSFWRGVASKKQALTALMIFGIVYNIVFIEEYLFGKINGSPYGLFREAKELIISDRNIKQVIVYNDIGGYEIRQTGKYFRRMYAAPQFEEEYKKILASFRGHVLVIDIPRIQSGSFYEKYLSRCVPIYGEVEKSITSTIFDCRENEYAQN